MKKQNVVVGIFVNGKINISGSDDAIFVSDSVGKRKDRDLEIDTTSK